MGIVRRGHNTGVLRLVLELVDSAAGPAQALYTWNEEDLLSTGFRSAAFRACAVEPPAPPPAPAPAVPLQEEPVWQSVGRVAVEPAPALPPLRVPTLSIWERDLPRDMNPEVLIDDYVDVFEETWRKDVKQDWMEIWPSYPKPHQWFDHERLWYEKYWPLTHPGGVAVFDEDQCRERRLRLLLEAVKRNRALDGGQPAVSASAVSRANKNTSWGTPSWDQNSTSQGCTARELPAGSGCLGSSCQHSPSYSSVSGNSVVTRIPNSVVTRIPSR